MSLWGNIKTRILQLEFRKLYSVVPGNLDRSWACSLVDFAVVRLQSNKIYNRIIILVQSAGISQSTSTELAPFAAANPAEDRAWRPVASVSLLLGRDYVALWPARPHAADAFRTSPLFPMRKYRLVPSWYKTREQSYRCRYCELFKPHWGWFLTENLPQLTFSRKRRWDICESEPTMVPGSTYYLINGLNFHRCFWARSPDLWWWFPSL